MMCRLLKLLAEALIDQRYVVDVVNDGEAAWQQVKVLQRLDTAGYDAPQTGWCQPLPTTALSWSWYTYLMLTARDTTTDKVAGLDADDYVVKPIELQELLVGFEPCCAEKFFVISDSSVGSLHLDPSIYEVTYENHPTLDSQRV